MKLTGKCAVVSAASKGLGLAIAEKLAAEGANLHLCSRDEKAIQTVADRLSSKYGVHVHAYQVDVSEKQALSDWIEAIQATNASIDALVCNAGGPPSRGFSVDIGITMGAIVSNEFDERGAYAARILSTLASRRWSCRNDCIDFSQSADRRIGVIEYVSHRSCRSDENIVD